MSEQAAKSTESYTKMIITVVLTVVGSWATVRNEIHTYIDTKMEAVRKDITSDVVNSVSGQMLQVMDSTKADIQAHQDAMSTRLDAIEEMVGVRVTNRTIITPPDTTGIKRLERRMAQMELGIEAVLDGLSRAERKRAHNALPQKE